MEIYIVVKKGVYDHGVMWVGQDVEDGKEKADYFASNNDDGYHSYELRIFVEPTTGGYDWKDKCDVVYIGVKAA